METLNPHKDIYHPKLVDAKPIEDYKLLLTFKNGERKIYDFKPNFSHPFFSILENEIIFSKVKVEDGQILWLTGQDFDPWCLYEDSMPA
jgi:hypothetical protein